MRIRCALLSLTFLASAVAQTQLDVRTQTKDVDFSSAASTKPFTVGTTLPATCVVGQAFFNSATTAGANWYACTSANTWTLQSGAATLAGDVTGPTGSNTVTKIQGRPVSTTAPTSGQSLAWSSSTNTWTPQTITGAQGPQGPAGPTGATGATGAQGPAGPAGASGATGAQGPAGPEGATGATGAQGPAGATGATGAAGVTGAAGAQGPAGPAGANGAIARIQNAGTNLPVEPTLNFSGGGCTDDPTNSRTDCTGSGGISGLTISTNGTTTGTQSTLNFISGTGITQTCANNSGSNRVDCTPSLNTAVALTIAVEQAGTPTFCNSTNGTTAYTCSFSGARALTAYTTGMFVVLRVDTTNMGSCSLNIDGLGITSITQNDGATAPASGAIAAGKFYWLFYDGNVFRMQ
jgi:hypothetical protein